MAGLAGALDPSLKVGDVVIDECSPDLPLNAPLRRGRIHTANQIVATAAQKTELFRTTGALVVEMENAIVRQRAIAASIPFMGIRAISDTADQTLDAQLLRLVDDCGRVKISALAARLLVRPASALSLLRLGRTSQFAARRLAEATSRVIECARRLTSPPPADRCA